MESSNSRTAISGLTSPEDRIAVLEDMVDFHSGLNMKGAVEILRIATALQDPDIADLGADELRTTIALAFADLTRLGRELAIDSLDNEPTRAAFRRWPFIAPHSGRLS